VLAPVAAAQVFPVWRRSWMQVRSPDRLAGRFPRVLQLLGAQRASPDSGEQHRLGVGVDVTGQVIRDERYEVRGDGDPAPARLGLRSLGDRRALSEEDPRLLDGQRSVQRVDVASAESKQLASAELAPGGQ
jgi:hypothetical protein